ncbi:MAG: efflux RND transporter periplasmic adaptor subunit [Elusimicrobiota bacterium]
MTACNRGQAPQPSAPEVATMTVAPQQIMLTTELPGRTSPYRVAEIRPQVSGLIQQRLFTEGSFVQAGQELYRIDSAPFQAVLDNAKASLERAKAKLPAVQSRASRYKEALADKAVSQQDYEDADSALKQTEADIQTWEATVETARINLGYTHILAPISGRIGKSAVTDGALVTAFQPVSLATVQQLDPIYVDVPQSSVELLRLKARLADGRLNRNVTRLNDVQLIQEDGTEYPLKGTLQFRDVSVDAMTGSVILRTVFQNPNDALLPGMFVRAVIKEGVNKQGILIPQQAVVRDTRGDPAAWVVGAEGKVEQKMLTLDRAIGDQWLVASGLAPGDRVIVEGRVKVRPGLAVKEVPYDASSKPSAQPPQAK